MKTRNLSASISASYYPRFALVSPSFHSRFAASAAEPVRVLRPDVEQCDRDGPAVRERSPRRRAPHAGARQRASGGRRQVPGRLRDTLSRRVHQTGTARSSRRRGESPTGKVAKSATLRAQGLARELVIACCFIIIIIIIILLVYGIL